MGIAGMIFTSIYVARALRASFFGVDVPVPALASITGSPDDVRATFTLSRLRIADTIVRAAYVTVTAYKARQERREMILNYVRFFLGRSLKRA